MCIRDRVLAKRLRIRYALSRPFARILPSCISLRAPVFSTLRVPRTTSDPVVGRTNLSTLCSAAQHRRSGFAHSIWLSGIGPAGKCPRGFRNVVTEAFTRNGGGILEAPEKCEVNAKLRYLRAVGERIERCLRLAAEEPDAAQRKSSPRLISVIRLLLTCSRRNSLYRTRSFYDSSRASV